MSAARQQQLDSETIQALYGEHSGALRRFLIGLLRDGAAAEDVLQTTFARLVERGHETQEQSRKAWLFQVAYREAMLVHRRSARDERALRHPVWSVGVDEDPLGGWLDRKEVISRVRDAIDQLPADQQQIVRLRIYEEQTFAEIAKQLDIPLGTALGRMRLALAKLRKKLDDET